MVRVAHSARFRASSICCGLGLFGVLLLATLAGGVERASASTSEATTSIVNGKPANISDWPWQVALIAPRPQSSRVSTRKLYFCSGSLIAPNLVLTAAHCVASLSRARLKGVQVVAGRTRLNTDAGESTSVKRRFMPVDQRGNRRYDDRFGAASWDVAILKLKSRLDAEPIKLAGTDETASWKPGRVVSTTGWGVTDSQRRLGSNVLRVARQVILPDPVCRRDNGGAYRSQSMVCLGGPAANASTCFGDSGGPLVAPVSTGWRIVGVTSFGDFACNPSFPSVDTRVSGPAIRSWVRRTALETSGVDPVGRGGVAGPRREWCQVPKLRGRTVGRARRALNDAGCRLGRVQRIDSGFFKQSGRTIGSSLIRGWLAPLGSRVNIWVTR